jgi:uncharacterized damage-inducible protein DinB
MPTEERSFPPGLGDERAVSTGWLEWQRATVRRKCEGLDEEAARRRPVPSSELSIASVVSHLRSVEWHWFERSFLGDDSDADPSGGWVLGSQPLAELLDAYDAQCARSRDIVAAHDLDAIEAYAPAGLPLVSLRWIVGHMTEETARHLGHLDLLREAIDGSRGY